MTRRLLAVAMSAAALLPTTAEAAPGCVATAQRPTWQHNFGATAAGSYTCDSPRALLGIEVCLESLGQTGFAAVMCETVEAGGVASLSAEAYGCRNGLWLIRTVTTGWSSAGDAGRAVSAPVPYFCTEL
ncbi:MAG TPA: hypothetical protein VNQ77_00850 [Frankiaceae bacterium]|nr:hypothetical protein [Frankiaceae bacterium]